MSDRIGITIDIEDGKASFTLENAPDTAVTKTQLSSVLRTIASGLPDSIPGEQPVLPMSMPPSVLAALLFITDDEGNVTLSLHENSGAPLQIDWKGITGAIHAFASQMEEHAL